MIEHEKLPEDGDVIRFTEAPTGSLIRVGPRYRVERQPGSREFLLVDLSTGHAGRVIVHDLRRSKFAAASEDEPVKVPEPGLGGPGVAGRGILEQEPLK